MRAKSRPAPALFSFDLHGGKQAPALRLASGCISGPVAPLSSAHFDPGSVPSPPPPPLPPTHTLPSPRAALPPPLQTGAAESLLLNHYPPFQALPPLRSPVTAQGPAGPAGAAAGGDGGEQSVRSHEGDTGSMEKEEEVRPCCFFEILVLCFVAGVALPAWRTGCICG